MTDSDTSWNRVGTELSELGRRLRDHYRSRGEEGHAEAEEEAERELTDALRTVGDAIERGARTIEDAFRDSDTKAAARRAAGALRDALADTFSEVGDEFRKLAGERRPESDVEWEPLRDEPVGSDEEE